jgi:hypothetical protein
MIKLKKLYLTRFKKVKYFLKFPFKCDLIIYTDINKQKLFESLSLEKKILYIYRFDYGINILFFILSFIIFFFKKISLKEKYFLFICKLYKPKLIVTTFDNDVFFYKIGKLTNTKTCIIQNGYRGYDNDIFSKLEKAENKDFFVDYKFLFGPSVGNLYNKYVNGKNIYIGSFANNFVKNIDKESSNLSIGFISQFREVKEYLADTDVLNFLNKYCLKNDIQLNIYLLGSKKIFGRASKILESELSYYNKILTCKKKLFIRNETLDNYKWLQNDNVIVNIDSTLGYEMLGRRKKVVFFNIRDTDEKYHGYCKQKTHNFGWPTKYEDYGVCWSNINNQSKFEEILNYAITTPNNVWRDKTNNIIDNIMKFDYQNKEIRRILI